MAIVAGTRVADPHDWRAVITKHRAEMLRYVHPELQHEPLEFAVRNPDIRVHRLLLELGNDPRRRSGDGEVLHRFAANQKKPEIVALLIDAGAPVDVRTATQRRTPLHAAAWDSESPAVVRVLVDRGADVDARSKHGWTRCTVRKKKFLQFANYRNEV